MILSSAIRAFVYSEAVDMRKSIDALSQLVSLGMGMNPLSGQVFVFIGRRRDKAKLLVWDRHGFCEPVKQNPQYLRSARAEGACLPLASVVRQVCRHSAVDRSTRRHDLLVYP